MKPESTPEKPLQESPEPGVLTYFLQFFGSLKLAMGLLAVLIGACIVGTLVESHFDTAVAQAYIYDSPWFLAWLVLLCMNLICSALVRYPWKPHLTGFVITHAGIVTVLIGAIIGRIWGVEGNITLSKGENPLNYLVTQQKLLEVRTGTMEQSLFQSLPIDVRVPSPDHPLSYDVNGVKVSVLEFAEDLGVKTIVEEGDQEGVPAIHMTMHSAMVPRPIEQWLVLGDAERSQADLGPAIVQLATDTAPPPKPTRPAVPGAPQVCREMRFAFANMPEMDVTRSVEGPPTGVQVVYLFDQTGEHQKSHGVLQVDVGDKKFEFPVGGILGKSTRLRETPWTLKVLKYFADFKMKGKEPVSVSEVPNNPALMFELVGKAVGVASASVGGHGGAMGHGHGQMSAPPGKNNLTFFRDASGKLRFEATSQRHGPTSGVIKPGEEFSPGWADWKITIDQQVQRAVVREELASMSEGMFRPLGASGVRVRVEKGADGQTEWVSMGTPVHFQLGNDSVHVSFGPRLHPLGFGVGLADFQVERDEGTQNPAGFRSRVQFIDPNTKAVTEREIWMNHPANFPDFPGVGLLGTAYKFSQASWNPNDLNQTTLQVLRDPGWSLKWIGSLMVCGGIFTMFYIKPYMVPKEEKKS